jgi:hypothetical protein
MVEEIMETVDAGFEPKKTKGWPKGRKRGARPPPPTLCVVPAEVLESFNQMERAIVARGRTVIVPDPRQMKVVGSTPEGKRIMKPIDMAYEAGSEIELPKAEIARLRVLGYVTDPSQKPLPLAEGSRFVESTNVI